MNTNRPINLNFFTIRFPMTAIISILHRISGVVLFLLIPFLLWILDGSINSEVYFNAMRMTMTGTTWKLIILIMMSAFTYHLIAGCRHLLMDMGIGESRTGGRLGSYFVIVLTVAGIALVGAYLWA